MTGPLPSQNPLSGEPTRSDTPGGSAHGGPLPIEPADDPRLAARRSRRRWLWTGAVVVIGVIGYVLVNRIVSDRAEARIAAAKAHQAVLVAVAPVRQGDLNRYLSAIGTVTAYNTVTVKTQVNGQIARVAFKEGQLVHKGDLLVQIDPRPFQAQLELAEGNLARDRATLKDAQITLVRDRALYASEVIARQDVDNQVAAEGQARGTVIADQANIDAAKLQLTYAHITSPITGRIGLRLVDPGNFVQTSDTTGIAVITQLQPIAVDFSIPEDDLPAVVNDMKNGAELPVDAFTRDLKTRLAAGTLETFDSQIDQTTGTIKLKAIFSNDENTLFPNQFVNVRMLIATLRGVVLMPTVAIQRNPQGSFVFVVNADSTVTLREVKLTAAQGDTSAVASGVTAGEMVVVDGVDRLQQGTRVATRVAANTPVASQ